MSDRIDQEGRAAFVQTLPRKITELRATLGTLVADPRSTRMRDELRRRLNALFTLARSYGLPHLSDGLREGVAHLDAVRGAATLSPRDLDTLAEAIASLFSAAQRDLPEHPELFARRSAGATGPNPALNAAALAPPGAGVAAAASGLEGPPRTRTELMFPAVRAPEPGAPATGATSAARAPATGATSATAVPLGVLVVGSSGLLQEVRGVLSPEAEVHAARAFAEAVSAARDTAPDVILAECAPPADGLALLAALRGDPLTDFIPVVLLSAPGDDVDEARAREQGASEWVPLPADRERLRAAIDRCASALLAPVAPPTNLREVTLEELTRTLTDELRRGLLEAAGPRANRARVALDGGSEVLAATWGAIARVREIVEKRTKGRVRFELPAAPLGASGAQVLALGEDGGDALGSNPGVEEDDPLPGRTALVVDDDPAVVRFFSSLLRDAGMRVLECGDGEAALREAREKRPDVVLSDILMPGLDGFALCGALRRDVALRHTPVVLLSWKDDLLLWMREVGAHAQGYLRKEARGEAIVARVRAVLRPRVRLLRRLEQLGEGAVLRGRVERVGLVALLETAGRSLRAATVTVTDASSVTELELRGGSVLAVQRTAHDGTLERGEAALVRVLGTSAARFSVQRATHPVRANVQGELSELLAGGAAVLTALEEAVTGASLHEVASVDLEVDAARSYARALPVGPRVLVERMLAGEGPRTLLLREHVAAEELEPLLVELARRGALRAVRGPAGQDLLAARASVTRDLAALAGLVEVSVEERAEAKRASVAPPPAGELRLGSAPHAPHVEAALAASERAASEKAAAGPAVAKKSAEPEADSLASAVLRELRAPRDEAPAAPPTSPATTAAPTAEAPAKSDERTRAEGPAANPEVAPARAPASAESSAATAKAEAPAEPSAPAGEGAGVSAVRAPAAEGAEEGAGTPARTSARPAAPERATAVFGGAASDGVEASEGAPSEELDARGLPRRRPRTVPPAHAVDPPAGEDAPTKQHRVATTSSSIIVDEDAVGAQVSVHEPSRPPPRPRDPDDETSPHGLALHGGGPSNTALALAVVALGMLSFLGVRAYLQMTDPAPAPPRPLVTASAQEPPRAAASAPTASAPTARREARSDAAAAPSAPAPSPGASASAAASAAPPEDEPPSSEQRAAPPAAQVAIEELSDQELADMVAGRGLLEVRGVADELVYDRRPLGAAPRSLQLAPASFVGLTYRRGATTGFVLVTIEAGRATRVTLPPP